MPGEPEGLTAHRPGSGTGGLPKSDTTQLMLQARACHQAGRLAECAELCRRILEGEPANAEILNLMGTMACRSGQAEEGIGYFRRAVEAKPGVPAFQTNLGKALMEAGRREQAVEVFRHALALSPDQAEAHFHLAEACFSLGRLDLAVAHYQRAVALRPTWHAAHLGLGQALLARGQGEAALASLARALAIVPDNVAAGMALANALSRLGRHREALEHYRRVLARQPALAPAHSNLAQCLSALGQHDEAIASQREALRLQPGNAQLHTNLGALLQRAGRMAEAVDSYRAALAREDSLVDARAGLGSALRELGEVEEAALHLRQALAARPDDARLHSDLLWTLCLWEGISAADLYAEHREYDRRHAMPLVAEQRPHANDRDPERRLRIGYVSPDLRTHALASFIEPILEYHDRSQVEVICYYCYPRADKVTERLRGLADGWVDAGRMADTALAERIRADGVDILIDLVGHTAHNRLQVFARKPAPVQVSWLGYPGTTGLTAMDYRLITVHAAAPGVLDDQFSEAIVYTSISGAFKPYEPAPEVNPLPALERGRVTFGSFNRPNKLGEQVIALWARVLKAVPGSRMLLGHMDDDQTIRRLTEAFGRHGVAPERLEFHPSQPMPEYLALHHRVDILLDSFPYAGGTTTNHALWMGVPVLTLLGDRLAQRQGASVLGRTGLTDWTVDNPDDYVARAVAAAADLPALAALRAGMRQRMLASQARQPEYVAGTLERTYRAMWRRWCAGLPPERLVVEP